MALTQFSVFKITLLLICFILSSCNWEDPPANDEPDPAPPPPLSGFNFEIIQVSTTQGYNPSQDNPFTVIVKPSFGTSLGAYRLFFELRYNGIVLGKSNYVYFNYDTFGSTDNKTLEWGGSGNFDFPNENGNVQIVVTMEEYLYGFFPNEDAEPKNELKRIYSSTIQFEEFNENLYQRTYSIEYDNEIDASMWDGIIRDEITSAFDPALLKIDFRMQTSSGNDADIEFADPEMELVHDNVAVLLDAVDMYRTNYGDDDLYILDVLTLFDSGGNSLPNIGGTTVFNNNQNGSFICSQNLRIRASQHNNDPREKFESQMLTNVLAHELAHQFGLNNQTDHTNHNFGIFCGLIPQTFFTASEFFLYTGIAGATTLENTHFCDQHIEALKIATNTIQ